MKFKTRLARLSVRSRAIIAISVTLVLLALGIEGFLIRYLFYHQDQHIRNYSQNLSRAISINIAADLAIDNIYNLDQIFLSLSDQENSGLAIQKMTLIDLNNIIVADIHPQKFNEHFVMADYFPDTQIREFPVVQSYQQNDRQLMATATRVYSNSNQIGTLFILFAIEKRNSVNTIIIISTALLTGLFILILGLLLINLLNQSVLEPLDILSKQANIILQGEFQKRIHLNRSDEFGQLAKSLDLMRQSFLAERKKIQISEKKFQLLADGSDDIIFTLDEDMTFLSGNKNLLQKLGVSPNQSINLRDLIYKHDSTNETFLQIFEEHLTDFKKTKRPVKFPVTLIAPFSLEPVQYRFFIQYVKLGEKKHEIFGKLSSVQNDRLSPYLIEEKCIYEIENYLTLSDELAQYLTKNLSHLLPPQEIIQIQIGIREMLINAMEHGNLDISFEEKTQVLKTRDYMKYLALKRQLPANLKKLVRIEVEYTQKCLSIRIRDEGDGFDYQKMRTIESYQHVEDNIISHGRGIRMCDEIFDVVEYNQKGNEVLLIKHLDSA